MTKITKARKYNSSKLQELFDEITPLEMEQTKVKMQLATRIEEFMKERGWNKSQFAEKVDKNPSEITKWLSGTQNFTIDVLTEIAFAFGIEVTALYSARQYQKIYQNEIVIRVTIPKTKVDITTPMTTVKEIFNFPKLTGIGNLSTKNNTYKA